MSESKSSFVRQSAWLAATTVLAGAFMAAVHPIASQMKPGQYGEYGAMLRLFLLLGIPGAGLQVFFAQQAAAAVTPTAQQRLAQTTRGMLLGIATLWCVMLLATFLAREALVRWLKLSDATVLLPTLAVALTTLTLPIFRGLLQGRQNFAALGWVALLDGAGRFVAIAVIVLKLHGHAAGAMTGAFVGQLLSLVVALWSTRDLWGEPPGASAVRVDWADCLRRLRPYTLGAAGLLVLANSDYLYLTAVLPPSFEVDRLYLPAMTVGFALMQMTVPFAMVMFPKIARSTATGTKTDALALALGGTAVLGVLGVLGVLALPKLPLQILYFRTPANWAAGPLVAWCVAAMLAFALANVLVTNQLARACFAVVPAVVLVALGFLGTLAWLAPQLPAMDPFAAYRLLAGVVGGFNLLLLALAAWLTWGRRQRP